MGWNSKKEARKIAHLFSFSMFVYLWHLRSESRCRVGAGEMHTQAYCPQRRACWLSLSVITSTLRRLASLRPDIPSTDSCPCIWMYFWSLLSTTEEGGIRPARRRGRSLKTASTSDSNGKDGAINSSLGQFLYCVCCFLNTTHVRNTDRISHWILVFVCLWPYGSCAPISVWSNIFSPLVRNCIFIPVGTIVSLHCFKMCISSSMVFISNLPF